MSVGSAISYATQRITEPVEGMHRAIAERWLPAVGPAGGPVRTATRLVYRSIRSGVGWLGAGLDAMTSPSSSTGDAATAWVNGLWGDHLAVDRHRLATAMTIRNGTGAPVLPGSQPTFSGATGRVVVLIHGLVNDERVWSGTDESPGLWQALDAHPAVTPVAVRYNTGLPVSDNADQLAAVMEDLRTSWPVPLESIALVGHSMGGLVALAADAAGRRAGHRWTALVTDIVTIGTPHRGAPLEKLAALAARGLGVATTTRPLATFLDRRSGGIRDLRRSIAATGAYAPAPDVSYHLIGGVATRNAGGVIGALVGDLMVRPSSSMGPPGMEAAHGELLGGVTHFGLPRARSVIEHVVNWVVPDAS